MPPPSLLQLCTATAIRNIKHLDDIGNIPYALARPFLLKVESPEKLRALELQSPHLMQDDEELWLEFIKRDIPRWEEYDLPEKPDCWYDVYCDLREQVQRAVDEDAEKLKMALDGISSERAKHSAKLVTDRRSIGLPRERPTMKQRYASLDRKMGGFKPVFVASKSGASQYDSLGAPAWGFERPSVPRSETKRKTGIFSATKRNSALAIPTKQLNTRASQIKQAPRSLVEEHRRPVEPAIPRRRDNTTVAMRAPGRSRMQTTAGSTGQNNLEVNSTLRDREARLRAIASGRPVGSLTGSSGPGTTGSPQCPRFSASPSTATANAVVPTAPGPRPIMVRKRPAPADPFIQPKKKRVN
ncbi:elongin A domain-containing protein [Aspergillus homomorphus CBS 101889]|uniref:Putative RNA polymerase II transcription factor SIII subunit A n=1 Tax=Aspergillus homomorphus (strain CBS 101889) TaxID=1450537 RepID=A0A395I5M7_ASPHC|nr:putative RNA polymerase II transcription factor SIII subunit A [Aspergillus homomorphus CBS 101889]RAL15076.1 putative RNA polymerase II transcription factor SIII subunit A [Aspergillus homomorphus CBS 101889]